MVPQVTKKVILIASLSLLAEVLEQLINRKILRIEHRNSSRRELKLFCFIIKFFVSGKSMYKTVVKHYK